MKILTKPFKNFEISSKKKKLKNLMISFRSIFEAKPKQDQLPLTGNTTLDSALQPLRQPVPEKVIVSPKIINNLNTIVTLLSGESTRALLRRLTHLQIVPENGEKTGSVGEEIKIEFTSVSPLIRLDIIGLNGKYVLANLPETLKEVKLINLQENVAESILFDEKKEWKSLEKLYINYCGITSFKKNSFTPFCFPRLNLLDLSNNEIMTLENINERPLDILIVNSNKINSINIPVVGSISYLSLDNNQITNLCPFGIFLQLRYLSIKNNLIEDLDNLKEAFSRLFNLNSISIENNPITDSKENLLSLCSCLPCISLGMNCKLNNKIITPTEVAEFIKKGPKTKENIKTIKQDITDKDVEEYISKKMNEVLNGHIDDEKLFETRNFLQKIYEIVENIKPKEDIDVNNIHLNDLINN
ncbi:Leucine-rich repeat containing protein [Entamoeba histolytica HM-3:IMSS]|uniref:Leucine-rich repeat containing protein n=6 Tax=Entamoeba histolytica TaxID=5759 RepID=C4LU12_ENTH1|nr:uncharacterized protein EHI_068190 [Entamoeba histolytica HM-1:IMSS]EMD47268.1 leucinerich repeat-containing protein [Entamoeba histolytica KU27]EMS13560.1 Leucine-rich repeat containing protein [Entamoeba histolytica HM-3:IMSS]ENY62391.1 Leucine-rich repeat containing protein [Entamoeba histolytica HM-1:IMSS-A]GAT92079.1 leucine-rich repeat containing protein [Entamoeba histolytica]EAL46340.2 leucine-rich repeat containing protein [Entamoeba histolytica HM-1:IMSS]|eukprot:XP_651727.2 uncharacterized protein EHI_068190 [Entamoeba histolytica HM-1:IMSS]